ncbi:MAG: TIGR02679 family protein [Rhizomicrobium sp.]
MRLVDERLRRLLGGDALLTLRKRLRQRYERGAVDGDLKRFRIANLGADEHAALAALAGRSVRLSSSMLVDVQAIDKALRQSGLARSLRDALEQIDGPIVHAETARLESMAAWSRVVSTARHPSLAQFLQAPVGTGLLKRLSRGDHARAVQLCVSADAVLAVLPAHGIARAQLAAQALGDAHALDGGKAVAALVLAVWRAVISPDRNVETLPDVEDDAVRRDIGERARDTWAKAGVLVNELARPALFLNLPAGDNASFTGVSGEPGYASLRLLVRSPPRWTVAGRDVFVCENPNLLAIAADRLGIDCAPIVCTDGMPAAAQRQLLTQLAQAGARLRYHGDFDWPGLRIGNHIMREYGALAWRFGAADYAAAVEAAPRPGRPLDGPDVAAAWDDMLAPAMRAHQLSIAEESVADGLLRDLAT